MKLCDIACGSVNRELVKHALEWFGMPLDSEIDVCESGQVYVGLTEILPRDSWTFESEGART